MKSLNALLALAALHGLTACYVWQPPAQPQQGYTQAGGTPLDQPPPTRYYDQAPPQNGPGPQQQPQGYDPGAPQAPGPIQQPPQNRPDPVVNNPPPVQQSTPTPPPSAPTPAPANTPAFGIKVPSKPGFVLSPYDKGARLVDVQGMASGTKVKCPYTGKVFVVP
jgi:hypothetical protein